MSCAGRSSDFRVRSVRPSRLHAGDEAGLIIHATMARRLDGPLLLTKHSVTAAGPSRNRTGVPCTSALPRERPTTNAQFKLQVFYRRPQVPSTGPADQNSFQPPPVHGHNLQRQPLPTGGFACCGDPPQQEKHQPPDRAYVNRQQTAAIGHFQPLQQFVRSPR